MLGPTPSELLESISSLLRKPLLAGSNCPPPADALPARAPAPFLPPELLALIFGHLKAAQAPPEDYASFARVNRAWLPHARLGLYSSVELRIEDREGSANGWLGMSPTATDAQIVEHYLNCTARPLVLLHRTLSDRPAADELRSLVEAVAVRVSGDGHVIEVEPAAKLLTDVLSWTVNVKTLELRALKVSHGRCLLDAVTQAGLGLDRCALTGEFDDDKDELRVFLAQQRSTLSELDLNVGFEDQAFPSDTPLDFPALRTLRLGPTRAGRRMLKQLTVNSHESLKTLDLFGPTHLIPLHAFRVLANLTVRMVCMPHDALLGPTLAAQVPYYLTGKASSTLKRVAFIAHPKIRSTSWVGLSDRLYTDWDSLVPPSVTELDCSQLLVHPRSFARWIETSSRGQPLERLIWCVPKVGWEPMEMENDERALVRLLAERAIEGVAVDEV